MRCAAAGAGTLQHRGGGDRAPPRLGRPVLRDGAVDVPLRPGTVAGLAFEPLGRSAAQLAAKASIAALKVALGRICADIRAGSGW